MKLQRILLILSLAAFLLTIFGGSAYLYSLREEEIDESHVLADQEVKALGEELSSYLYDNQNTARALAGLNELQQSLRRPNAKALGRAYAVLVYFRDALDVNICYLMDKKGDVVGSSDRGTRDSIYGKNYAFRPYFTEAMQGVFAVYPAVGATTGKRGIYYSYPVYTESGQPPAGVAVIKTSVEPIEKKLANRSFSGIVSITDPHGIVFISTRKDLVDRALWKLTPETVAEVTRSRQFGDRAPDWAGMERNGRYAVDASGNRFMIHESPIAGLDGWKIVYLHDMKTVSETALVLLFRLVAAMIALFCVFIGIAVFVLYRKANDEIVLRQQAEELLGQERDRAQGYLDVAGVMLTALDAAGNIMMINPKGCEILGYRREELIGENWFDVFLQESERGRARSMLRQLLSGSIHQFKYFEIKVLTKKGEEREVVFHNTIVRDSSGTVTGVLFSGDDVTQRRRMEAELQRTLNLESIGFLAGGMAHDFNNLLNVIFGYISLAKMRLKPGDELYGMLDESEHACHRAAELTGKLITFSEGGAPFPEEVSMTELIKGQCVARPECRGIRCEYHIPEDLISVKADKEQIRQVVKNIFRNACEAMPEGGVVFISAENADIAAGAGLMLREGAYVRLSIKDSGPGIPEDMLPKVFDPYFTSKKMGVKRGVGLGLTICYSIVKRHDGLITCETKQGVGTTFHIYLPAFEKKEQETEQ